MEPFLFEAYEALPYVQGIEIGGTDQERTTFRPVFRRRGDDSTVYYEMRDKQHINNPPRLGHIKYCHVLRRYGNTDPPVYQSSNERVIVKVFEFQKVQQHFDSPECPFREMEALRMIVEPNRHVATVDAIMQDRDGNIHMAMPLRKGNCTALDEILLAKERGQRLGTSYARLLFRHLIRGLKYIHQLGLYHGDISCENFIVGEHDSSTPYGYIIDFGVALRAPPHALIHPRLFPGKPCYQSPEVSTQEPFYPEKADIWSCGIVCLNMLTGYLYTGSDFERFHARSENATAAKVLYNIDSLLQRVPLSAANLIRGMLQEDAASRFSIVDIENHAWFRDD